MFLYEISFKHCLQRGQLDGFIRYFVQMLSRMPPLHWFYTKFRINDAVEGAGSNML